MAFCAQAGGDQCARHRALDADAGVAWVGRLAREDWIGPQHAPRGQPPWRPFAGPLSPRSQQHALTIVQSLMQFLVGQGYLWRNPLASVKGRVAVSMAVQVGHAFNAAQWQYILAFLAAEKAGIDALGEGRATARVAASYGRNRFVIYLGYGTGLRLTELTAATLGDLKREAGEGLADFYWVLNVIGKGNKPRVVPLPDRVAEELVTYLRSRGLPAHLKDCDGALPLIDRLRQDDYALPTNGQARTTLAPSSIYRSLKLFFGRCAVALEGEGNTVAAERLRAASTHWLWHTHGTLGVRAGNGHGPSIRVHRPNSSVCHEFQMYLEASGYGRDRAKTQRECRIKSKLLQITLSHTVLAQGLSSPLTLDRYKTFPNQRHYPSNAGSMPSQHVAPYDVRTRAVVCSRSKTKQLTRMIELARRA